MTSTVTIKTPDPEESMRSSANPAVWKGEINMPDVADFGVTAHQGKILIVCTGGSPILRFFLD